LGWFFGRRFAFAAPASASTFSERIAELERKSGGRLGVSVFNTATGARFGHRADERFPMCSTHKFVSAAAILARVDQGRERLDRVVHFAKEDHQPYSPVTQSHAGDVGITVRERCEAAVTLSDNTAANLLLASIGGPAGWTAYVRSLGDEVTRLDRNEPKLNDALPGDPRDTTSPNAIASDMRKLVLGDALSNSSHELLTKWLVGCKTGTQRLHAGVPPDWKEGDKTGTGQRGTSNDVAIFWPSNPAPIVVAAYLTQSALDDAERDRILAAVGGIASDFVQQ
jgi:beta-lactamase class A